MKKGIRIILWIIALCLIISFFTFPLADCLEQDLYYILTGFSSFIISLLAVSGIIIIYRLKKQELKSML